MGIEARLERFKLIRTIILLWSVMFLFGMQTKEASPEVEISYKRSYTMDTLDHSKKRILARGCDPHLSLAFSKKIPPYIGNPEYVPTTNDEDFFHKLKTENGLLFISHPELVGTVPPKKEFRALIKKQKHGPWMNIKSLPLNCRAKTFSLLNRFMKKTRSKN